VGAIDILCFELVWQDEIRIPEDLFISWNHILIDVDSPLVTHNWVKYCTMKPGQILGLDAEIEIVAYPRKKSLASWWTLSVGRVLSFQ
jgi:hypothetical protein